MKKEILVLTLLLALAMPVYANGDSYPVGESYSLPTESDEYLDIGVQCSNDVESLWIDSNIWNDTEDRRLLYYWTSQYNPTYNGSLQVSAGDYSMRLCCYWASVYQCTGYTNFTVTDNGLDTSDAPSDWSIDCTSCDSGEQLAVERKYANEGYRMWDGNESTQDCAWYGSAYGDADYYTEYDKKDGYDGAEFEIKFYQNLSSYCGIGYNTVTVTEEIPQSCWDYDNDTVYMRSDTCYTCIGGYGRVSIYCQNSTGWQLLNQYDDPIYDGKGLPFLNEEMTWTTTEVEEEAGYMQTILSDVGAGTGAFIEVITDPFMNVIIAISLTVGSLAIVYGLSSIFKGVLSRK